MVSEAAATASEGASGHIERIPIESRCNDNEAVIAGEVESAVKELVANEMAAMVQEALDEALHKTLHKAKSGVRSVVCNVVQQEMLDLLRKGVTGYTLNAHIAKYFDTGAAPKGMSKSLLTSRLFMVPITTVATREMDTAK